MATKIQLPKISDYTNVLKDLLLIRENDCGVSDTYRTESIFKGTSHN